MNLNWELVFSSKNLKRKLKETFIKYMEKYEKIEYFQYFIIAF